MNKNRFEMHFHTREVSACATVSATQSIVWYKKLDYAGVIVTDHYTRQFFESTGETDWELQIDHYLAGYDLAAKTAGNSGLVVLPGMEIRFDENGNDYLVYGISRKFLIDYPRLYQMKILTFYPLAKKNGLMVYQAHPFRDDMTLTNPRHMDGLEICNASPRNDSRNDIAALWSDKFQMLTIAGSDFHQPGDEGRAGLDFKAPVPDQDALVRLLTNQAYTIVQ